MKAGTMRKLFSVVSIAVVLALPVAGLAKGFPGTVNVIQVQATYNGHSATFQEVFPVANFDGVLSWSLPTPVVLSSGEYNLGTISDLQVNFNADPEVDLEFALTNSSMTDAVMYDISTATIVFDPVANAEAAALASVTLTPGAGSTPGASITGLLNGKVYEARYSTDPILNTATSFAQLVSSFSVSGIGGASMTEGLPAEGMASLGTTVYMMESEFKFILSAGDQASGSSIFIITPEPGSIALMGLAGLALLRRGRSR